MKINYSLIDCAEKHYNNYGFKYIDIPWVVTFRSIESTLPFGKTAFKINEFGWLIGSAEQGFVELIKNNEIKFDQRYQSTSTCFRDDEEDELHQKYFVKNELFYLSSDHNLEHCWNVVDFFVDCSTKYFKKQGLNLKTIDSGKYQIDIIEKNTEIELGSYGIRDWKLSGDEYKWIYGTGCAEPRLSITLDKL